MNDYSIALFLHVVGALGFFVALGLEGASLHQLRSASTAPKVREWLRVFVGLRKAGMISMLTLLATGAYMMVTVWVALRGSP